MTVEQRIKHVISQGGKCSYPEYRAIWDSIRKHKGDVNLLVFGTGHDTPLWAEANHKGKTTFVENSPKWAEFGKEKGFNVVQVAYDSKTLVKDEIHPADKLVLQLPGIETQKWTHIFVDGPVGRTQGRMKSIHKAYQLADADTKIFVHDYNRKTEKLYCDHFFEVTEVIHRLAVCQLP